MNKKCDSGKCPFGETEFLDVISTGNCSMQRNSICAFVPKYVDWVIYTFRVGSILKLNFKITFFA